MAAALIRMICNFNPRSREGSDIKRLEEVAAVENFNPRSREGSDNNCVLRDGPGSNFNPRSREGSDEAETIKMEAYADFNPRSREGSDAKRLHLSRVKDNFNPRSREGSDESEQQSEPEAEAFQSTLPRRERPKAGFLPTPLTVISIHAPAKGATFLFSICLCLFDYFNPRSREGSDVVAYHS